MYEYKYIYIVDMNIYENMYSVRKLVVYIRLCENSCQSQTVVEPQNHAFAYKKKKKKWIDTTRFYASTVPFS